MQTERKKIFWSPWNCKRKIELKWVFIMALQRRTSCCLTDLHNPHIYGIQQTNIRDQNVSLFLVSLVESSVIITHKWKEIHSSSPVL